MYSENSDVVSNYLKWILLLTATVCFAALIWGTYITYQQVPPQPEKFLTSDGKTLFTQADIIEGKAGFQQADLMDYGSLYGMGSYYGEDYTAQYLVRIGDYVEKALAVQIFHKPLPQLTEDEKLIVRHRMQNTLRHIDLTQKKLILVPELVSAIQPLQQEIGAHLLSNDFTIGWTKAYSLTPESAKQVADFLIYSSLTTVSYRPGKDYSYTNNWPYEPS